MRIAPEGWPFIAPASLAAGMALFGAVRFDAPAWWIAAGLLVVVAAWMAWFFRDPVRHGPDDPRLVLAPADGRVVAVLDEVAEPVFVRAPARRVSIFLNIFDVHVNRYPVGGKLELYRHERGKFLHAESEEASRVNERATLGIQSERGRVLVRQIAGLVARRIVTDHREGAEVRQGKRLGIIRFGSRVDVFVPREVQVTVLPGARVRAGLTVIGEWPT